MILVRTICLFFIAYFGQMCLHTLKYCLSFDKGGNTVKDTDGSYRMGKLALQFLSKFNAIDQLPIVYLQWVKVSHLGAENFLRCSTSWLILYENSRYYGYIAVHREPFQACAEMLRQAHEIGLSIGDIPTAVLNGIHYIQKVSWFGLKISCFALLIVLLRCQKMHVADFLRVS